jgi:hypothetical protein
MPDPSPAPEVPPADGPGTPDPAPEAAPPDAAPEDITYYRSTTEEMDSARWRLPPALPVIAAALAVGLGVAIFTFVLGRPLATGEILHVIGVEQASKDSVLVVINVSLKNVSKNAVFIKDIQAEMAPAADAKDQTVLKDEAASAVDYPRYFQAYPALAQNDTEALRPETRLQPGETQQGIIIVEFPVNQEGFDKRKSLAVVITLYDHSAPIRIQQ